MHFFVHTAEVATVGLVLVDDRKDCCPRRFAGIDLLVGNARADAAEPNAMCSRKSYRFGEATTYRSLV